MITLDLQTFEQNSEGGNVTGVIFLELHDGAFPGRANTRLWLQLDENLKILRVWRRED